MEFPSHPHPSTPQERIEYLLEEQVRLLRIIAGDLEEERRIRRMKTLVRVVLEFCKYGVLLGTLWFSLWYAEQLLNSTLLQLQQSIPKVPEFRLDTVPGIGNFDLKNL